MRKKSQVLFEIRNCLKYFEFFSFGTKLNSVQIIRLFLKYLITMGLCLYAIYFKINCNEKSFISYYVWIYLIGTILKGILPQIDSILYRKLDDNFFEIIAEVEEILLNETPIKIDYKSLNRSCKRMLCFLSSFYLIINLIIIYDNVKLNPILLLVILPYMIPSILIQIFLHKFVFMMRILHINIKTLNKILENLNHDENCFNESKLWRQKISQAQIQIIVVEKIYHKLYYVSMILNQIFEKSILIQIFVIFISFINVGYRILLSFIEKNTSNLLRFLCTILSHFVELYSLYYSSQKCLNEVNSDDFI